MHQKIHRREFMRRSAGAAAAAVPCALTPGRIIALGHVDVAVVTGKDHLKSTRKAVEMLGGISGFVPKGSRVAVLANVQRWFPGTFTHPEVLRSVLRMCKEAGASEINCISLLPEKNWEATGLAKVIREEGAALKIVSRGDPSPFRTVPVPGGKILKQAEIMQAFFDNDVFINMPITKDHAGNKFTGAMKNLMGLNSSASNRTFHKDDWQTNKDSVAFLDQCIADLNTVIRPALNLVDATEFIVTNGPMGPGEIRRPQKVVAGTDRIAVDSYCTTLLGMKGADIVTVQRGSEHKLGEMDLKKVNIREASI